MVSVIMLTYNRETLVSRAIESILAQTYREFEFIIVDNGSTDHSGAIADTYAAKDKRIRVLHRQRGNIGAGRNTGLDAAQGEYIAFIDDDDWAEPDFLAFLLELAKESDADVAICGAADKIFEEKKVMTAEEALVELMWRRKYNMAFPTKLFRRELMDNLRFPEEGAYDDIALMYRLLAEAKRVAYHGLPKYTFYRHPGNNSAWTTDHGLLTPETLEEYLHAYRTRTEWLSGKFPDSAAVWRYFEWSFMISMVEKIHRLNLTACHPQMRRMEAALLTNFEEFLSCGLTLDFERDWMKQYIVKKEYPSMEEKLVARRLAIVPTTKCSLNCRLCADFLYGPVKRREIPFEDVCRDIDACFELFDHVVWLQFVGGEVFVYPAFARLLDYAQKYRDRFDRIIIETNATVFPNAEEQEAILRYGDSISIYISDYGELSKARDQFVAFAEQNHIHCQLKKYFGEDQYFDGWIDNTDPRDLKEPGDVLEVNARNCPQALIKNMHCYDGKLHRCSNSCFMLEMKLFPPKEGDFVELRDTSKTVEEKRNIIRRFYDYARRSCHYCKQKYMAILPRYPAAEQVRRETAEE